MWVYLKDDLEEKKKKKSKPKKAKKKKSDRVGNVDWREPIDTNKKAAIYQQNKKELDSLNDLLSHMSVNGNVNIDFGAIDEEDSDELESADKLKVLKLRKRRKKRVRANKCLLILSDDESAEIGMAKEKIAKKSKKKQKPKKKQKERKKKVMKSKDVKGWNCGCCDFYNLYSLTQASGECEMCGMKQSIEIPESNELDISVLMENLDLTNEQKKRSKKASKKNVSKKSSALNTSTATFNWKCNKCKTTIPINIYVCPTCG